jgi:hypothetical protein
LLSLLVEIKSDPDLCLGGFLLSDQAPVLCPMIFQNTLGIRGDGLKQELAANTHLKAADTGRTLAQDGRVLVYTA